MSIFQRLGNPAARGILDRLNRQQFQGYPNQMGITPRASLLDGDVTTVIKETDDDSPNTRTTTIKPNTKSVNPHDGMKPSQVSLLNTLNGFIDEASSGEQVNPFNPLDTTGGQGDVSGNAFKNPHLGEQAWVGQANPFNPLPGGSPQVDVGQPPQGPNTPPPSHTTAGRSTTEMGGVMPNYGAQREQLMRELGGMIPPSTQPTNPFDPLPPGSPQGDVSGNAFKNPHLGENEWVGQANPFNPLPGGSPQGDVSGNAFKNPHLGEKEWTGQPQPPWTPGEPADMQWNPMYPNPQEGTRNGLGRSDDLRSTYGITDAAGGKLPSSREALVGRRDPNDPWPSRELLDAEKNIPFGPNGPNERVDVGMTGIGDVDEPGSGPGGQRDVVDTRVSVGNPHKTEASAKTAVVDTATDDPTSNTVDGKSPNSQQQDELARTWGKLAYDPAARRKEYIDRMNKIFRNTAMLEAMAIMTGNPSRAAGYNQMMMGMLDQEIKFDSEDRLYELGRSLYYDQNGKFDPPESKMDAFHALIKMGASIDEATAITGHVPESVAKDLVEWYRINPQTGLKETVHVPGKKGRPAGSGWSKSREWVEGQWDDENPNSSGISTTENERNRILEQMLLRELKINEPGTKNWNAAVTQLRAITDGTPFKRFWDMYGDHDSPLAGKWKSLQIPTGELDKDGKMITRNPKTFEEAQGWWSDPSNDSITSFNYTMGWTKKQQGIVSTTANEGLTREKVIELVLDKKPDATPGEIQATLDRYGL